MTGYLVLATFLILCWLAWPRTDRRTGPCGCSCRYCKTKGCTR